MSRLTDNTTQTYLPNKNKKFSILIIGAGIGNRMLSYGPKPFLTIKNKTILERQLSNINKVFKKKEIIFVCGFQYEKIKNKIPKHLKVVVNNEFETTNVSYSIKVGLDHCSTDNVLIIYGDLVFNVSCLKCPFNNESAVVIDKLNTMNEREIGCIINKGLIQNFSYDIPNKWSQIMYLCNDELSLFKKYVNDKKNKNKYGFEGLNYILEKGGKLKSFFPKRMKVMDVDCVSDIPVAENMI